MTTSETEQEYDFYFLIDLNSLEISARNRAAACARGAGASLIPRFLRAILSNKIEITAFEAGHLITSENGNDQPLIVSLGQSQIGASWILSYDIQSIFILFSCKYLKKAL